MSWFNFNWSSTPNASQKEFNNFTKSLDRIQARDEEMSHKFDRMRGLIERMDTITKDRKFGEEK